MQGSVGPDKSGQFHPCAPIEAGDPAYYPQVLGCLCSPYPDAAAFSNPAPPGKRGWGQLLTSFGLAFSLHKAEVNVSACREEGSARSVVVCTTSALVAQVASGLALCVP